MAVLFVGGNFLLDTGIVLDTILIFLIQTKEKAPKAYFLRQKCVSSIATV
jgi:hypothetical protein